MKTLRLPSLLALLLALGSLLNSCKKETNPADPAAALNPAASRQPDEPGFADNAMVLYWNDKAQTIINLPITPPAQSRYFAIIEIAVHDALNAIKPKYQRMALLQERSPFANPDAAVASAAYWAIKGLNIQGSNPIDSWYTESLATIPDGPGKEEGILLGKNAADAIIALRSTDHFAQANVQVPQPDGIAPGEYRSTLPFSNPGMPRIKALHQWGILMTPFVTPNNSAFRPVPPYPVNSPAYTADFNEVKAKGARVASTRTPDEDEIGRFWVERSSIGWNRFARNIVAAKKMDAWKTARLFALLHTAITDGLSGCFEAKYHYFYWRPETAIRLAGADGNDNTVADAGWLPSNIETPNLLNPALNINTPPIPDYPSAHATGGGAAAQIMRMFFGSDQVDVNQTSSTTPGVTRHYTSLSQAARDNSLSRIYVGYHFRNACMAGESQGTLVGEYVFQHSFQEQ